MWIPIYKTCRVELFCWKQNGKRNRKPKDSCISALSCQIPVGCSLKYLVRAPQLSGVQFENTCLNFRPINKGYVVLTGGGEQLATVQGQTSRQPWGAPSQTLNSQRKILTFCQDPTCSRHFLYLIRPLSQLYKWSGWPFICFLREYSNLFQNICGLSPAAYRTLLS